VTGSTQNAAPSEVSCIECKTRIPREATLCSKCSSYQKAWKNWLRFFASIAGFVAVAVSGVFFIIGKLPDVRRTLFWRDSVEVIRFKSDERLVAMNRSDGPVYLSHVSLVMDLSPWGTRTATARVGLVVPPGEVAVYRFPETRESLSFVGAVPDKNWNIALREVFKLDNKCFSPVVMRATDPEIEQVEVAHASAGQHVRKFPATADLHFYSLRDGAERLQPIIASGVIVFSATPDCEVRE
jgi:hypothetical protein